MEAFYSPQGEVSIFSLVVRFGPVYYCFYCMSTPNDVVRILQSYTKRSRQAVMSFSELLEFTGKYLGKYVDEFPDLEDLYDKTEDLLSAHLLALEKSGRCRLDYKSGRISEVDYVEFYPLVVNAAYTKAKEQSHLSFPTEESLPIDIPENRITVVNVKDQFADWLSRTDEKPPQVLRLIFPEGVRSIVSTTELLARLVPDIAVQRIRNYLRVEKNAGYMRSRLLGIFKNRDMALKDFLDKIQTNPNEALATVLAPNDFTFHVWTTLCSVIVKEFSKKKDKLQEDHDYEQAAYLLGYYNVYHKALVQKKRDTESALRAIDNNLKRAPYVFTMSDIHSFTDTKGVPLSKHCTVDDMNQHVKQRMTPKEGESLPELVRFRGPDKKDYYIRKESIVRFLIEALYDISREFQEHYVAFFKRALQEDEKPKVMLEDPAFNDDADNRLRSHEPIVYGLLTYDLLSVASRELKPPQTAAEEIARILDTKNRKVRPVYEVLKLDRKELFRQAKVLLPFWQAVPVLRGLVKFLVAFMTGRPKPKRGRKAKGRTSAVSSASQFAGADEAGVREEATMQFGTMPGDTGDAASSAGGAATATRKGQTVAYREAIQALQEDYLEPGKTAKTTLEELAERWNPLLDPVARRNLVEDVNSLVRDFLRRMRVGFRMVPPDRHRIRELSAKLVENDAFREVRQKEPLRRYLELYMLTILGKQ